MTLFNLYYVQGSKLGVPTHDCEAWPFGGFLLRESVPYKLPTFLITTLPVTEQTTTGSECVYNYGNYGTVRPITCGGGGKAQQKANNPGLLHRGRALPSKWRDGEEQPPFLGGRIEGSVRIGRAYCGSYEARVLSRSN